MESSGYMDKIKQMLGLAMRAGKITTGEESVIKNIKNGKAKLLVIATDTSSSNIKMYQDKAKYYAVKQILYGTKLELGQAIGKNERSACAIIDRGFAKKILELMQQKYGGAMHDKNSCI